MNTRTVITMLSAGTVLLWVSGCTKPKDSVVQSQKQRNWLEADPSAISSATELAEPRILPKTHFAAARLFEQQRQIEKAIIQYRKAVAVNHEYVEAYTSLGVLLGRVGRHADAEAALRRAVELRPQSAALRNNLGYEYALQSRWADAEAELNNAISLKPDFARAHVNLGMVLAKQQRFEEAFETFNAVLPEPDAFYNLGLLLAYQHRYHDAADAFNHVLTLNPEFAAASRQLELIAPKLTLETPLEPITDITRTLAANNSAEPMAIEVDSRIAQLADDPDQETDRAGQPQAMLAHAVTEAEIDDPPGYIDEMDVIDDSEDTIPCPDQDLDDPYATGTEEQIDYMGADLSSEAHEPQIDEPSMPPAISEDVLADAMSETIITQLERSTVSLAELTSAQSVTPGPQLDDDSERPPTSLADDTDLSLGRVRYDLSQLRDDTAWDGEMVAWSTQQDAYAPAWYAAASRGAPINSAQPSGRPAIADWFAVPEPTGNEALVGTQPDAWMPSTSFYPPSPELRPDESVNWFEPCPPHAWDD